MFRFEHPYYLSGLGLIPILIVAYFLIKRWKKKALSSVGNSSIIENLIPDNSLVKPALKLWLTCIAVFFLVIAIANPQFGSKLEEIKREGVDIIIALDVSNSMKAEDLVPNRLVNAKQAISRLVDELRDDRIGIIVFGGEAYVQLPLTTDYAAAKLFLNTIDTDIIPTQGTAIGAAIELGMQSFEAKSTTSKALIVLTDGENHEDDALKMAEEAVAKGIVVHTIGMGSESGAPIPLYVNGRSAGFKKDREGNTVITKLNEQMLQQIAAAGHGAYIRANNSQTGLKAIFNEINKMQKTDFGTKKYTDYESRYQYFIFPALVLLILELMISNRKSKFWERIDLFGEKKK